MIPWLPISVATALVGGVTMLVRYFRFSRTLVRVALSYQGLTPTSPRVVAALGPNAPQDWCGAIVQAWIREAANGKTPPIAGSAQAKAYTDQFKAGARWIDASALRAKPSLIEPGMVAVWSRGDPSSWTGHVGVVTSSDGKGLFTTIEGNNGPTIQTHGRSVAADNLIGMGAW